MQHNILPRACTVCAFAHVSVQTCVCATVDIIAMAKNGAPSSSICSDQSCQVGPGHMGLPSAATRMNGITRSEKNELLGIDPIFLFPQLCPVRSLPQTDCPQEHIF